jgi:hypothetical protein
LFTWWKNNVERRTKFKILQDDAKYKNNDVRKMARARWCESVVALSEVIRASSGSSCATKGKSLFLLNKVKKPTLSKVSFASQAC